MARSRFKDSKFEISRRHFLNKEGQIGMHNHDGPGWTQVDNFTREFESIVIAMAVPPPRRAYFFKKGNSKHYHRYV